MDLKDFVKESLVQISSAIIEANEALEGTNAVVNPFNIVTLSGSERAYGRVNDAYSEKEPVVEVVEFDVAVTTESGTQTGGGIRISVASIGLGAEGKSTGAHSNESRIKFKVPMVYPSVKACG